MRLRFKLREVAPTRLFSAELSSGVVSWGLLFLVDVTFVLIKLQGLKCEVSLFYDIDRENNLAVSGLDDV